MPTLKYYQRTIKNVDGVDREVIKCVTAKVKSAKDVPAVAARPDFIRFRCGGLSIEEVIVRQKRRGSSEWYV